MGHRLAVEAGEGEQKEKTGGLLTAAWSKGVDGEPPVSWCCPLASATAAVEAGESEGESASAMPQHKDSASPRKAFPMHHQKATRAVDHK